MALLVALGAAQPAVLRGRAAAIALAAALYALAIIHRGGPLPFLLFWIAAGLALLLPRRAGFDDGWRRSQRLLLHGVVALAGPLIDWSRAARARRARHSSGRGAWRAVLPLAVLPIMGTAVFAWLFALANPVIERWFASFGGLRFDAMSVLRVLLWLLLAWGVLRPRPAHRVAGLFDGSGETGWSGIAPASVLVSLALFNLLFLLQNAMDAAWLWGLAPLPEGITLAQYAHCGAYPLIVPSPVPW